MRRSYHWSYISLACLMLVALSACAPTAQISAGHTPTQPATATPTVTPAPASSLFIFTKSGGNTVLYRLAASSGAVQWKTAPFAGHPIQPPILVGQTVILGISSANPKAVMYGSATMQVVGVDVGSGATSWQVEIPNVYYSGGTDYLALKQGGPSLAVLGYSTTSDASTFATTVMAFSDTPTSPLWKVALSNQGLAAIACIHQIVYVGTYDSVAKQLILATYSAATGTLAWRRALAGTRTRSGIVFTADTLVVLQSADGTEQSWQLVGYSLTDGSRQWGAGTGNLGVLYGGTQGLVYSPGATAKYDRAVLAFNDGNGALRWALANPGGYPQMAGDGDNVFVTFDDYGYASASQVTSVSSSLGYVNWSVQYTKQSISPPADSETAVYVGVSTGETSSVIALSKQDGKEEWRQSIPGDVTSVAPGPA